jgi:tripartite-type tricarboxylate transporter receptor subunit TctC
VPYRGAPDIVTALKAGQLQMTLLTYGSLKPYIDGGTLKPIFTRGSEKRSALLPDVPSYAEAGLPALDAKSWAGMFAPHGTPPDVIAKLNREITAIIADPQFQARFMAQPGLLPPSIKYQDIGQFLAKDRDAWAKVVKATGTKLK